MTTEQAVIVGLSATPEVDQLIADIGSAAARGRKADPGDRGDIARFEALATQLEQIAIRQAEGEAVIEIPIAAVDQEMMLFGTRPEDWEDQIPAEIRSQVADLASRGLRPVVLVTPLEPGTGRVPVENVAAALPAERWESSGAKGRKAVEERFRAQISEALDPHVTADGLPRAISPSGISNPVVTEILREFTQAVSGMETVWAPVEYRDGSKSENPFALRSLALNSDMPSGGLELRFALLSIRHTEMDAVVHGAWLRNAEISRRRPAAQTDDLVYQITRTQLDELTSGDRTVELYLYQTGLETAVVGFYKALVDHLLDQPGSVAVQPMYYSGSTGQRQNGRGRKSLKSRKRPRAVTQDRSPFRKGTPWAM